MNRFVTAAAAAATLVLGAPGAHAANLLTNGSFETGDGSGWTLTGNTGYFGINYSCTAAQDGCYFVHEGPVNSEGFLSQTFTDTPGDKLTISGWWNGCGCGGPSDIRFLLNGVQLWTTGDPVPADGWTHEVVTATATGSDTFTVAFQNNPGYSDLDNFSITQSVAGVPEPAEWALMILGLGLVGGALRGYGRLNRELDSLQA